MILLSSRSCIPQFESVWHETNQCSSDLFHVRPNTSIAQCWTQLPICQAPTKNCAGEDVDLDFYQSDVLSTVDLITNIVFTVDMMVGMLVHSPDIICCFCCYHWCPAEPNLYSFITVSFLSKFCKGCCWLGFGSSKLLYRRIQHAWLCCRSHWMAGRNSGNWKLFCIPSLASFAPITPHKILPRDSSYCGLNISQH